MIANDETFERIDAVYQVIGRDLFESDDLRRNLAQRDRDEAAFFTLVAVSAEVDNGGFDQFFSNSTGDLIAEAIAGADRFGLVEHAQLLRDVSAALFPMGVPLDWDERLRVMEERGDLGGGATEAFDERWYELDDALEQRLDEYAKTYPLP